MNPLFLLVAITLLITASGCAALNRSASAPAGLPVSATISPPTETATAAPPPPPNPPDSVYRNPKIGVVYLRAYQDTAGRLFGSQVMYQIAEPGGWNLDALDPGSGELAAVRQEMGRDAPSIVPARETKSNVHPALLDPAQAGKMILTGLMRPQDQTQAEAMACRAGDRVALFDAEAGWLLMPAESTAKP